MSNLADQHARAFLADYRNAADARLRTLLDERRGQLAQRPFEVARYFDGMADYALRGGKRLRGALVVLGHQAVGRHSAPEALEASLAFELLHAFLLAYDDFMDRDEVRRGGASLHVLAAREAARRAASDPAHRGVSVTLLLGLLVQSMAFDCLRRARAGVDVRDYFDHVSQGVTEGQLLDVIAVDASDATPAQISVIHQLKTGLYTTEGPLVLGALLAGASRHGAQVTALRGWAAPVGEAFQLVDDILGAVGDAEETGKPACGDLREGKRSAVLEQALVLLAGVRRARLQALAGRPLDATQAEEARALIVESGAPERVRAQARALGQQGLSALESGAFDESTRELFEGLTRLVVERRS